MNMEARYRGAKDLLQITEEFTYRRLISREKIVFLLFSIEHISQKFSNLHFEPIILPL